MISLRTAVEVLAFMVLTANFLTFLAIVATDGECGMWDVFGFRDPLRNDWCMDKFITKSTKTMRRYFDGVDRTLSEEFDTSHC